MKKLTFILSLFPLLCTAQKASLGIGVGGSFFSPVNTKPLSVVADQRLAFALYTHADLSFLLTDNCTAIVSYARTRLQTEPYPINAFMGEGRVLYAQNMNHMMLRLNRVIADGLYFGITSGFTFYTNPDSVKIAKNYPGKFTVTERGNGFVAGAQLGYRQPLSDLVDVGAEIAFLYNGIAAYKTIKGVLYAPNYSYTAYPTCISLHYKIGEDGKGKKESKEPTKKKRRSYEDEEWGK